MAISMEQVDDVARITLDDGKVNAMDVSLFAELNSLLTEAENQSRAVVLAGRPGCFSAGFNIKVLQGDDEQAREQVIAGGAALALRLFTFPRPLVIAATGHAFALGAVWLLCADLRIGESGDYKFGLNETAIGEVLPPFGFEPGMMRIPAAHQMEAMVFAKIYDGPGAVEAGYLDRLADHGKAVDEAMNSAAKLAALPTDAYYGNKMAVRGAAAARMEAAI